MKNLTAIVSNVVWPAFTVSLAPTPAAAQPNIERDQAIVVQPGVPAPVIRNISESIPSFYDINPVLFPTIEKNSWIRLQLATNFWDPISNKMIKAKKWFDATAIQATLADQYDYALVPITPLAQHRNIANFFTAYEGQAHNQDDGLQRRQLHIESYYHRNPTVPGECHQE
ncbi:MAG: hypothetical protein KDI79_21390 [Anaerolineae bacterium]|nr:hypothetical protein [Anaerolineae bacterium]